MTIELTRSNETARTSPYDDDKGIMGRAALAAQKLEELDGQIEIVSEDRYDEVYAQYQDAWRKYINAQDELEAMRKNGASLAERERYETEIVKPLYNQATILMQRAHAIRKALDEKQAA